MNSGRTQVDVLYEILAEETLRACREIAILRDEVPRIVSQASRQIDDTTDETVTRLKVASRTLFDAAQSMEELSHQISRGLMDARIRLEFSIEEANQKSLQKSMEILNTQAIAFAVNAARTAMAADLGQISREVATTTIQLQEAVKSGTRQVSKIGWMAGVKIAVLVAVACMTVLTVDKLIQHPLPVVLSDTQLHHLLQGQALTAIWPKLDPGTQEKLRQADKALLPPN